MKRCAPSGWTAQRRSCHRRSSSCETPCVALRCSQRDAGRCYFPWSTFPPNARIILRSSRTTDCRFARSGLPGMSPLTPTAISRKARCPGTPSKPGLPVPPAHRGTAQYLVASPPTETRRGRRRTGRWACRRHSGVEWKARGRRRRRQGLRWRRHVPGPVVGAIEHLKDDGIRELRCASSLDDEPALRRQRVGEEGAPGYSRANRRG